MIKKRKKLFWGTTVLSLIIVTVLETGIKTGFIAQISIIQGIVTNPDVHFWIWMLEILFILVMIRACGYVE